MGIGRRVAGLWGFCGAQQERPDLPGQPARAPRVLQPLGVLAVTLRVIQGYRAACQLGGSSVLDDVLLFWLEMSLGRRWRAQNARLLAWVVPDRRFRARLPGRRPFGAGLIVTAAVTVVAAGTCWVVKRSADRAHGWAIRPVARCDTGEQETDRGAAQVVAGGRAGI